MYLSSSPAPSIPADRKHLRDEVNPLVPALLLDAEGTVLHATPACRRLLEYPADLPIDPCFFTQVHPSSRARVMRDLTEMVVYGRREVHWFLQLRTGHGPWRWYTAVAQNHLRNSIVAILVALRPLAR